MYYFSVPHPLLVAKSVRRFSVIQAVRALKVDSSLLHATLKAVGKVCWSSGACVEMIYRPARGVTLASLSCSPK